MKTNYFFSVLFTTLLFVSCTEEYPSASLNESEIFFNETLTSISKDWKDLELYYIGTENGIVYVYHSGSNHIDTLKTDFDRIYKVVRDSYETETYWLGTRNDGLRKCYQRGDSLLTLNEGYRLEQKGLHYSCYDIVSHAPYVYMATSQGLFAVHEERDKVHAIYTKRNSKNELTPLAVNHLTIYKDSLLIATTDDGIVKIDLQSDELSCQPTAIKEKSSKVLTEGDKAYTFSKGILRTLDSGLEQILDSTSSGLEEAQVYYQANGICYFIGSNHLAVVDSSKLKNLIEYKHINLRRTARTDCYNVIVDDIHHNQSLLITDNALFKIAYHLDALNDVGDVTYATTNQETVYFLVDGSNLFKQEKDDNAAKQIYTIPYGRKAQAIAISGKNLFYADMQRKIWRVNIGKSYELNTLFSHENLVTDTLKRRITAMASYHGHVLIGVQDGMICVSDTKSNIINNMMDSLRSSYITRFTNVEDSLLYVSTLNDGAFVVDHTSIRRATPPMSFIRDVARMNDSLYVLTNHSLYQQVNGFLWAKDSSTSGYYKLLQPTMCHHIIAVGNRGLFDVSDSIQHFQDIHFEPNACIATKSKIYVGGSSGVMVLDFENKGDSPSIESLSFKPAKDWFTRQNILLLAGVILLIIFGWWWYDRYRISQDSLLTYQESLLARLAKLKMMFPHLNEETCSHIDDLEQQVKDVDTTKKKNSLKSMKALSRSIMEQTEGITFMMTQKLRTQIEEIEKTDIEKASRYMDTTNDSIKAHTLLLLGEKIEQNDLFLTESAPILERYNYYRASLQGIAIPMVKDRIEEIFKTKYKDSVVNMIDKYLGNIDINTTNIVRNYLTTQIERVETLQSEFSSLDRKTALYKVLTELAEEYKTYVMVEDISEVIKNVPLRDCRFELIKKLHSLPQKVANCLGKHEEYEALDSKLAPNSTYYTRLSEDEKKIAKKVDKEKRGRCNEEAHEITEDILNTIESFYISLEQCPDQKLMKLFDMKQKKGKGRRSMWENVLALLMSGTTYNEKDYSKVLGYDSSRIRDAHSKIKKNIANRLQDFAEYEETNHSSIAVLLLSIQVAR